jgi:hypothetical protein
VPFRDDILRGVRLFAIAFAGILLCVAAYRMLRSPFEAQGSQSELVAPAAPPAARETATEATPASEAASESHPLVVPPPPPVGGEPPPPPVRRVVRPRPQAEPGAPPVVGAKSAPVPSGKEFESAAVGGALAAAPGDQPSESAPVAGKKGVGYKSLLEAGANRVPEEPIVQSPADEPAEKPAKGNRFFKAVGKIFHPGGKKETAPSALEPKQPK